LSPRYGHVILVSDTLFLQVSVDHNMVSNIKEVHGKPRLHFSLFGVWPPCCATVVVVVHAPMSNTASHDNHEKINSLLSFSFLYEYGAPLSGPSSRRSSGIKQTKKTKMSAPLMSEPMQATTVTSRRSKSVYSGFTPQYQFALYENAY